MENYEGLLKVIIDALQEKKGKEIVSLDLTKLDYAACESFIICHGESAPQVRALADAVEEKAEELFSVKVRHREGLENARWILLDYGISVVHIFLKEARDYYRLEDLWGDADITLFKDE